MQLVEEDKEQLPENSSLLGFSPKRDTYYSPALVVELIRG